MARDGIETNDRQLACARINSTEGQDYLSAMSCAANYAWVNRSSMTFLCRQAFAKMFDASPGRLGHARGVRRVAQHREDRRAYGGRKVKDASRASKGEHARVPAASPAHPGGLPVHRSAGVDRRHDGDVLVHPHGHARRACETRSGARATAPGARAAATTRRTSLDSTTTFWRSSRRRASPFASRRRSSSWRRRRRSYKDVTEVVNTCHDAGISKKCGQAAPDRRRQGLDNHHH